MRNCSRFLSLSHCYFDNQKFHEPHCCNKGTSLNSVHLNSRYFFICFLRHDAHFGIEALILYGAWSAFWCSSEGSGNVFVFIFVLKILRQEQLKRSWLISHNLNVFHHAVSKNTFFLENRSMPIACTIIAHFSFSNIVTRDITFDKDFSTLVLFWNASSQDSVKGKLRVSFGE